MKAFQKLGVGLGCSIVSAGVWLACNGDNSSNTNTDSGADSTSSSSSGGSSGSGSSGGSGSSSGSSGSSSGSSGSSSGATEAGGDSGEASTMDAGEAGALSFATDIWGPIISMHCVGCHGVSDAGPGFGIIVGHLDMGDAAAAYTNLMSGDGGVTPQGGGEGGAAMISCASFATTDAGIAVRRVVPNDVPHSLFCNKVASKEDGGPAVFCGNPMPAVGPALAPGDITTIKAWINQGAQP